MEADFSGYVTKAGLKCSDGRTITPQAFKHMNEATVPLVWQHGHNTPENVLGHVRLEAREDGVYGYGYFNDTPSGLHAKASVIHKDITAMSIYANGLVERAKSVLHGVIREVSLVLSGANPGAKIDWVQVVHSDDYSETLADEAVIYTGLELSLQHAEESTDDKPEPTVREIYDAMSDEEKNVVHFMIGKALEAADTDGVEHSADVEEEKPAEKEEAKDDDLAHEEGNTEMTRNVFDQNGGGTAVEDKHVLTHDAMKGIFESAARGGSMKRAVEEYALSHGIENISTLFPDPKLLADRPEFKKRRTEWVAAVMNGVSHTPFSRIKNMWADITQDEARALGYITGSFKKEEWFGVAKRTTTPTTVYKKQKLDRDYILDITDFDVVAWLKHEMRIMMEEELARAILLGDGRDIGDNDKIKDPAGATDGEGVRSIKNEHELFASTINVNIDDASSSYMEVVDAIIRMRRLYKGTGAPTLFTTEIHLAEMLLLRDESASNRYLFDNVEQLASRLRVAAIVTVEPMEAHSDLIGIMVNLSDYNVGTDRGGELTMFDDFDIDYNQYKYLMETRLSGALTKLSCAIVIKKVASGAALVNPITAPTFVASTGVITIPTQTGVVYKNNGGATLTAGAQSALAAGASMTVTAHPASASYYFASNQEDAWTFKRPA